MGATTSLASRQLSVTPGGSVDATVQVRNNGTLVDQFTVDIVGDAREWTEVEPRIMNLMPGQDGQVTIKFAPPRKSSVPAGFVPFGVRVLSREEPHGSVVEEGVVQVEPFTDLQVELSPKSSRCRTKARHQVVVDNSGNYPIPVELVANDPDDELKLGLDHSALTVQPGTSAFLKLTAKPHDRFLKGPERRHPFQVTALAGDIPPTTVQGTVVQQQLLPKWLLPALIALIALAIVAVTLWFTVVKPTVQSAARETAKTEAAAAQAALQQKADTAEQKAAAAEQKAAAAEAKVAQAPAGNGTPAPGPVTGPDGVDISKGTSFDTRIAGEITANPNPNAFTTVGTADPEIPAGKTLVITDLLLQNPHGDSGTIRILRGGKVLYEFGLSNFRDYDYHSIAPLTFGPTQKLEIAINCQTPGAPEPATGKCKPSVTFSGRIAG
ncbi:MAG TPA: hypothetical protein VGX25_29680 [Actinophytocola sp.]|uniref:COG1470 family protein n=1 Tax=Actinophytocola sp. TaxID=1872138 RepID=UPI002DDDA2AD|nr:hypothetical protein [Actinophytocola sp.]HEV2783577.1 hypothetical protein [Actinophytocola sp.]